MINKNFHIVYCKTNKYRKGKYYFHLYRGKEWMGYTFFMFAKYNRFVFDDSWMVTKGKHSRRKLEILLSRYFIEN